MGDKKIFLILGIMLIAVLIVILICIIARPPAPPAIPSIVYISGIEEEEEEEEDKVGPKIGPNPKVQYTAQNGESLIRTTSKHPDAWIPLSNFVPYPAELPRQIFPSVPPVPMDSKKMGLLASPS